jgi:hypothetical protein
MVSEGGVEWSGASGHHALAVCGDAVCENFITEFTEAFFGVVGGGAFEEEDVEVRHCVVLFVWNAVVGTEVGGTRVGGAATLRCLGAYYSTFTSRRPRSPVYKCEG